MPWLFVKAGRLNYCILNIRVVLMPEQITGLLESSGLKHMLFTPATCGPWSHGLRPRKALSVASVTLVANFKGDNEMILGLCTGLLAFALQPKKTPENLS